MATVTGFRSNFFGVRPNRFLVQGEFPVEALLLGGVSIGPEDLRIYVKGADLPGSTIGSINISWQGRVVKFSGDRQYADWVIQVYDCNIPNADIRNAFEGWMEAMDTRDGHAINYSLTADWIVRYSDLAPGNPYTIDNGAGSQNPEQFNKAVKLRNCWPVDLGAIALNYDAADTFSEFTVQMAYDFWEPYDG